MKTPSNNLMFISLAIALVISVVYFNHRKVEAKKDARARADVTQCKNDDDDWVKTPAGFYRDNEGTCIKGTPPLVQTAPQQHAVEALVLEHECYTPCSANIAWRFKIIWGDNPLRITYPGGQVVDRRGKDEDFQAPSNMQSGETKFESLEPNNPHFRVRVYRVTYR
jgi:hypothetical protein